MPKGTNIAIEGSEQPSVDQSEDEEIQDILGEYAPSSLSEETPEDQKTEDNPDTKDPESSEGDEENSEVKEDKGRTEENPSDEKKPDSSKAPESEEKQKENMAKRDEPRKPSRLDRRISRLYIELQTLTGNDTSNLDEDQIAAYVATFPTEKRQAELHKLLAETKRIRGDKTPAEFSNEDFDAIADERAEEKLREREKQAREQAFKDDFVKTYEECPELDEAKKQYDPAFAEAVEGLVRSGQYLLSEAVEKIRGLTTTAEEKAEQQEASKKRKALSGALSGSGSKVQNDSLSYEDLARIQKEDPERYLKIVESGDLPEE